MKFFLLIACSRTLADFDDLKLLFFLYSIGFIDRGIFYQEVTIDHIAMEAAEKKICPSERKPVILSSY